MDIVTTKYCGEGSAKLLVQLEDIVVEKDRARRIFEDINGLADSIWEHGLMAPLVVEPLVNQPGKVRLIAGERRLRAHFILAMRHGVTHAHCNPMGELSPRQRKELELEENLRRKSLDPFEEIENLRQLHELKQAEHGVTASGSSAPGWSLADTAKATNQAASTVSEKIKLGTKLKTRPDLKELVKHLPINAAIKQVMQIEQREKVQRLHDQGSLKVVHNLINGDAVDELLKLPDASVDLVIIDPPFGIANIADSEGEGGLGGQSYTGIVKPDDNLTTDSALALMERVLPELARVMKPSAHIYIFHANQLRAAIVSILQTTSIIHSPDQIIIWNKIKTSTPFMGYKFMSVYEPILFGMKAPGQKRLASPEKLVIECPPTVDKIKIHVFQKPQDLLYKLIKLSSNIGDVVLDCFAGSGATCKAAQSLGRSFIGIEKNKDHWLSAQQWLGDGLPAQPTNGEGSGGKS